jgi:putative ABC transport system permease protein
MLRFLLKGIISDNSRSLLPIIVVSIGAMLTVLLNSWIKGLMEESIEMNARFNFGHVKVMSRAYAKDADQMPNDLALTGAGQLLNGLKSSYTDFSWVERIRFNGLMDFPDSSGETRVQGPAIGWAVDLLSPGSKEKDRLNIDKSIVSGRIPQKQGEALISDDFTKIYKIKTGETFTLFGSTMDGSMAFRNFTVAGTVRFGSTGIDRGAMIIDIHDAQQAFNMEDAAGEILGFLKSGHFDDQKTKAVADDFNAKFKNNKDEFAPVMITMRNQSGMGEYLDYTQSIEALLVVIFVIAMSIVLWNAGLLGGLRRYREFGVRLALGEEKGHLYKTLIYEGILIGSIGSIIGTAIGLGAALYLQVVGIDISGILQNSSLMMPTIMRAAVTPSSFFLGFIPGLFSTVVGNALAGIGIYKRQTAMLFKELEV